MSAHRWTPHLVPEGHVSCASCHAVARPHFELRGGAVTYVPRYWVPGSLEPSFVEPPCGAPAAPATSTPTPALSGPGEHAEVT